MGLLSPDLQSAVNLADVKASVARKGKIAACAERLLVAMLAGGRGEMHAAKAAALLARELYRELDENE